MHVFVLCLVLLFAASACEEAEVEVEESYLTVYNCRVHDKALHPDKVVLDKLSGKRMEYEINGVTYELQYEYTRPKGVSFGYDVDVYSVLNAEPYFNGSINKPMIFFVSGTDKLHRIHNLKVTEARSIKNKQDLAEIANEFLSKYVDLGDFKVDEVNMPRRNANSFSDIGVYSYSMEFDGYKAGATMPEVSVTAQGEIVGVFLPNMEYLQEFKNREFNIDVKECEKAMVKSISDYFKTECWIKVENIYVLISGDGKSCAYFNTTVFSKVRGNNLSEPMPFVVELEQS